MSNSTQPLTLVIMAAGMGSRYGGLKQIDPVGPSGEIVLEYSVYDAVQAGFNRVVFVIRRDIEQPFKEAVAARLDPALAVDYVFQDLNDIPAPFKVPEARAKPWGTAHAVRTCRDAVDTPFAVINADDFYGRSSFRLLADALRATDPGRPDYVLVGFRLRNTLSEHGTVSRAICRVDLQGRLIDVVERLTIEKTDSGARYLEGETWTPLVGDEPVSMNMWGFTPALFPDLDAAFVRFLERHIETPKSEFLIPTVIDALLREGEATVRVPYSDASWLGVTYPEDKPIVAAGIRAMVDQGVYPSPLWSVP